MVTAALIECRTEYVAGTLIFVLRYLTRIRTVGLRGLYWDDVFSFSAWVFFTLIYAMVEYLGVVGAPIGLTQEQREALPSAMKKSMREGAKGMFASFFFLIFLVWSLKASLIVLFLHLTKNTRLRQYVWFISGLSAVCFLAACITQLTHCLPMKRNWQILPDPGRECSEGIIINIVIAVGNVLVDALLLVVPTLMLKDARITLFRKVKIGFLLSLGMFVMGMAIARCILSIGSSTQVAQSSVWAQREALVSIFAVNAPVLNALFKRETWSTGNNSSAAKYSYGSKGTAPSNNSALGKKKNKFEIYKMTDIETSSKGSTSELVHGNTGWHQASATTVGAAKSEAGQMPGTMV